MKFDYSKFEKVETEPQLKYFPFITGSHAYGTPRPDSDIDLVVLMQPSVKELLIALLGCDTGPVRAGNLNLIICESREQYEVWYRVTQQLKLQAPVDHDTAKVIFTYEMKKDGIDLTFKKISG